MLKKAALVVLAIVAVLAIVVAMRPATYQVTRSTQVAASPAVAFAQVNDFHKWKGWSPWEKLDPSMKTTFAGAATGVGAVYSWTGNDKVGEGRMTITDSRADQEVVIKLEFLKPWEATSTTTFTFVPDGPNTRVTWNMIGTNNYVAKAFTLFANMDAMIGKDFENGLAALKVQAEAAHAAEKAAALAAAPAAVAAPAPATAPIPAMAAAPATP